MKQIQSISHSGFYTYSDNEFFQLRQGEAGTRLVSGKECLIRYFAPEDIINNIHSVIIRISAPGEELNEIFIPHCGLLTNESEAGKSGIGFILKGFQLSHSGEYRINFRFMNPEGILLSDLVLPPIQFAYDIDYFLDGWIPHGLVI